jgi:hypothetical protein
MQYYDHLFLKITFGIVDGICAYTLLSQVGIIETKKTSIHTINIKQIKVLN